MANSISVAVGESETMWLGRFVSVTVAPLPPFTVTGKPAVAGGGPVAVPPGPQAVSRAAPPAARMGAMRLRLRSRGHGFVWAASLALVALRCFRIAYLPAAMVHLALGIPRRRRSSS